MAVVIVLVLLAVAALLFVLTRYNRVVRLRNACRNGWALVEVQLKRRSDLIPNLVATVQGYAAHERNTLEAVIQARRVADTAQTAAERSASEGPLTQALGRLFALQEAYPDLKADRNFIALQEELASTENLIAYARQAFNDAVTAYNNAIQTFPTVLIASAASFVAQELFVAPPEAATVPRVQF